MNHNLGKQFCRVALAAAFGLTVAGTAMADETVFVPGTAVNGQRIGDLTVEQAAESISGFYTREYKLTIKERGGAEEMISGPEIGLTVSLPEGSLQQILSEQNEGGRAFGPNVDNKHRIDMSNTFNMDALNSRINGLNCISGSNIVITSDARISDYQEGEPFVIIPEIQGNNVYRDKTAEVIRAAVASGATEVDLEAAGCYYEPKVTKEDAQLLELCNTMNRCRDMSVTYVFGENTEVLEAAEICTWITGAQDGQIQVNQDKAAAYVKALADKYNTAGTERTFRTATGREAVVSGSYGWRIHQQAETNALIDVIRTGESQSREPHYDLTAVNHTAQEWGNTYVEIDLTGQHVYMIKDGALVWDAPCVTGNIAKKYDTPAGIYTLTYKERNRVLRGRKRADGTYEYESPVSYWMPFNGGIGLHDANWRGSFGGTIYKSNGSHGCVNLPPAKTKALYDMVYKGIPVICYH